MRDPATVRALHEHHNQAEPAVVLRDSDESDQCDVRPDRDQAVEEFTEEYESSAVSVRQVHDNEVRGFDQPVPAASEEVVDAEL